MISDMEKAIRAEMRMQALENVVVNFTAAALWFFDQFKPGLSDRFDTALREKALKVSSPDLDPAMSDMVAGELQDAIEKLLQRIREQVEAPGPHPER
jgi:hypothetical protein